MDDCVRLTTLEYARSYSPIDTTRHIVLTLPVPEKVIEYDSLALPRLQGMQQSQLDVAQENLARFQQGKSAVLASHEMPLTYASAGLLYVFHDCSTMLDYALFTRRKESNVLSNITGYSINLDGSLSELYDPRRTGLRVSLDDMLVFANDALVFPCYGSDDFGLAGPAAARARELGRPATTTRIVDFFDMPRRFNKDFVEVVTQPEKRISSLFCNVSWDPHKAALDFLTAVYVSVSSIDSIDVENLPVYDSLALGKKLLRSRVLVPLNVFSGELHPCLELRGWREPKAEHPFSDYTLSRTAQDVVANFLRK